MTHISTRKSGTLCYRTGVGYKWVHVEAVVISSGVFIAEVFAESTDGKEFTRLVEVKDIMRPVTDIKWYESLQDNKDGDE